MVPLTQSKMHEELAPAPEQPVARRRSTLVIEILGFVLIVFLVVSALLFNLTASGPLVSAPPAVSVALPPKPGEQAAPAPSPVPIAQETHLEAESEPAIAEPEPANAAALPEVQPEAGLPATLQVDTGQVSPPEEIATLPPAFTPVPQEAAPAAASEPAPMPVAEVASMALPAKEIDALLRRGDELLAIGDIAAARSAYERAAAGGDRTAALGVAKTYDPIFLAQNGVRGLRGDPGRAALWYAKAAAAGDRTAQQRLRQLRAQYPSDMR